MFFVSKEVNIIFKRAQWSAEAEAGVKKEGAVSSANADISCKNVSRKRQHLK